MSEQASAGESAPEAPQGESHRRAGRIAVCGGRRRGGAIGLGALMIVLGQQGQRPAEPVPAQLAHKTASITSNHLYTTADISIGVVRGPLSASPPTCS